MFLPALSIRQPWAFFVTHGYKPIENRDWKPWSPGLKFRGKFLIHASKTMTNADFDTAKHTIEQIPEALERLKANGGITRPQLKANQGGIVGMGEIVDVVTESDDPWFFGPYGLVIANAKPLPFMPINGRLGFFPVEYREAA